MTDVLIIGGGLAGLLLAEELVSLGAETTVVDNEHPMRGSSSPATLMHAFPGRSLKPSPLLKAAYQKSQARIHAWRHKKNDLARECRIERPLNTEQADRLRRSYETYWAHGQDSWLTFDATNRSRLIYGPAYCVNLSAACDLMRKDRGEHVRLVADTVVAIDPCSEGWVVSSTCHRMEAQKVVIAAGAGMHLFFPKLGSVEGGDLLLTQDRWPSNRMVADSGIHIAPRPGAEGLSIGSTRWPVDAPLGEREATAKLISHLERTLECSRESSKPFLWRGQRSICAADRMPVCGPVPSYPGLFVLSGFGGKGLLWAPLSASLLAEAIMTGAPMPAALSTARLPPSVWAMHAPPLE